MLPAQTGSLLSCCHGYESQRHPFLFIGTSFIPNARRWIGRAAAKPMITSGNGWKISLISFPSMLLLVSLPIATGDIKMAVKKKRAARMRRKGMVMTLVFLMVFSLLTMRRIDVLRLPLLPLLTKYRRRSCGKRIVAYGPEYDNKTSAISFIRFIESWRQQPTSQSVRKKRTACR